MKRGDYYSIMAMLCLIAALVSTGAWAIVGFSIASIVNWISAFVAGWRGER